MTLGERCWAERFVGPAQLQQWDPCLPDPGKPGELVPMRAECCPCVGVGREHC